MADGAHDRPAGLTAHPAGPLHGVVETPGDKSMSHRALILGAMAVGRSEIAGLLEGEDVLATARAMAALGALVERGADGVWRVDGVGVGGFMEPADVIDCGNAGTGVRLIMGAVATTAIAVTFTGDASLRSRPMGRVTGPLAAFGARAYGRSGGRLPLTLIGAADPIGVTHRLAVPSAQVKSAVLLAGLAAPGETSVIEPTPTRDHTERMLAGFGAALREETDDDGARVVTVTGQGELSPQAVTVPGDPSSAAFAVVAATLVEGSDVLARNVGVNPTRDGLYRTLREMGADLTFENARETGGEPVADIRARFGALKGVVVPPERAPSMIDEYPVLAVAAAFAEGTTVMRGIGEMRVKESDRIDATARMLEACGVTVEEDADTLVVHGRGADGVPGGATVAARLDHRIAMSALALGLAARAPVAVDDAAPIATSYPGFADAIAGLGGRLERT
jgi:3-phosphoshikimate 1-carboxyvinyltransferase